MLNLELTHLMANGVSVAIVQPATPVLLPSSNDVDDIDEAIAWCEDALVRERVQSRKPALH